MSAPGAAACGNCGAALTGEFCAACGQKRLGPGDRTLAHLLGEAFRQVTEVDGKLLRSLRLLLFRPGLLSREYMDDRRARYTAPLSLFLLANVLYFFSPAMSDFNLPFRDQVTGPGNTGQVHSQWTAPLVARKLAARRAAEPGYDLRRLALDYDAEAGVVGKVLIIAHVPIVALLLALVYARRRRYFAEHFVVALHAFTFLLLFGQLVVTPLNWIAAHVDVDVPHLLGQGIGLAMLGSLLGYFLLSCRNAYRAGWLAALAGMGAVLVGLLFANIVVYRALQFVATLALL